MDLSCQCGYTLEQQVSLFHSIRLLFSGKPLVAVLNKCDVATLEDAEPQERDAVMAAIEMAGAKWIATSVAADIGVSDLKTLASGMLEEKERAASLTDIGVLLQDGLVVGVQKSGGEAE